MQRSMMTPAPYQPVQPQGKLTKLDDRALPSYSQTRGKGLCLVDI